MEKRTLTLWSMALLVCLFGAQAFGQVTVNMPYNTGVTPTFTVAPPTTCTFNFFDNGGSAANYSVNSNPLLSIVTFAPSVATNKIQAVFSAFQTETTFDALYVYDGGTTGSPLISSGQPIGQTFMAGGWQGTTAPFNFAPNTVRATAGNATGRLTFQFDSDASVTFLGWAAAVAEAPTGACALTAPANITASTGAVNCTATVTTPLPVQTPAGCAAAFTLQYSVNGGPFTVIAQPLPATLAIPNLPKGPNVIVWQLVSSCGGTIVASVTQTITVNDLVAPVITCPANVTLNLAPGACRIAYTYTVGLTDNCPFFVQQPVVQFPVSFDPHGTGLVFSYAGNTLPGGYYFNVTNVSTLNLSVTGFGIRWGAPQFGVVPSPQNVNVYTSATYVGNQANPGAWTSLGPQSVVVQPYFPTGTGTLSQLNLSSVVSIPPTQTRGFYIFGTAACPIFNWNFGGAVAPITNGPFRVTAGDLSSALFTPAGLGPGMPNIQIQSANITTPTPVQTAGLPSGAEFPIGTTTNCYIGTDAAGNTATCCFNVTVNEYPNAITSLVCNDFVEISLDEDCAFCMGADDILEGGPYRCYDNYIVEVDRTLPFGNGPWAPACFGSSDVGHTFQVRVTDPLTGNRCWGLVKIEDKLAPELTCCDLALPCNANTDPVFGSIDLTSTISFPVQPILDLQTTTGTATLSACTGSTITDVNVQVNVTHTWIGDVRLTLISPQGTPVVLWANNCGNSTNLNFTADDEAAICSNLCTDYGLGLTLRPIGCLGPGAGTTDLLSKFDGQNPNGTWTLTASDNVGADQGTINTFKVFVAYTSPNGTAPIVVENCGAYTLTYIDTEVAGDCASGVERTIVRKWTATDASGNTSTCIQNIDLTIPTLDDVVCPPDYDGIDNPAFLCTDNAYPTPDWIEGQGLQGYPYVFGLPIGCTIGWEYEDVVIHVCDGTYKIRRQWTIIDWCAGTSIECNQIIKVMDNVGPTMACPANMTVSTDPFTCCATVNLPDLILNDNCSRINNISAMVTTFDPQTGLQTGMQIVGGTLTTFPGNNYWNRDTLGVWGYTTCLPLGAHTVVYTAEDDCGNTSTCSFRLTVRDYTPPVAACDEYTVVAIGIDDPFDCYGPAGPQGQGPDALTACEGAGVTWVKAKTFDDGSYDNCGYIHFTVRRMAPYSDCINGLNQSNGHPACDDLFPDFPSEFERAISEYDSIKFYCCEVGTTQTVILRVYQTDIDGNISVGPDGSPIYNECMVQIEVQDKLKPVCQSPLNMTVSCENFDPSLWAYGIPTIYDNCCLDTTKVYQGQCGLTHTPSYTQFDTLCNRGTINRTFRAYDCHGFSSQCTQRIIVNYEQDYWIHFPDDKIVTVCDGTGTYGEPTFANDQDCELLGVSYEDVIYTVVPDACYKIERTWTIINWCTYNPNLPCIDVPNPNPNATVNHPSNLPGPIVSPCGTPAPWNPTIVKINSTDPAPTNYCTFWDANANCYRYKQIIKILDNQDPIVNCPASPVEICDLTANDPLFWNEMYWWDNTIGSHNLCEAPTDLCITATDACSGADLQVRYILFLDLDGDGIMETVISSSNLPGFNNVNYNNYQNQNFAGGTPRSFDERPVPFNQKYGFALQQTTSGTNRTACVRWNTSQSPNTFVIPQLPYGTHKIKWIVADGCGNETVCEYTFIVRDCKKPTVVCLNGLSVNIMPTGMITLWASDFLQYTEDNCTPANLLKIGIVKSAESTGTFPVDGNGNPITSVTFTCAELGTQPVQLWSIDLAGNADFCETYVIVQDNMGNCGPAGGNATVAGALKTEATQGLEEGSVQLQGSGPGVPNINQFGLTNNSGSYNFSSAVPMSGQYTLTPTDDDNPLNGVTTFDLVLMSKHILGLQPLTSPYQQIAADINKSGSITTYDIVELRKLILGIYTELPANTSWRFVDKAFVFPNPTNAFQTVFPETKSVADVQASHMTEDFVSVKIGDVNGSAIPNSLVNADDRSVGTLLLDVQDRDVKAGEAFDVTMKADQVAQGYQFTLNLNGLEVADIVKGDKVDASNFGVFNDKQALTASIDGASEFTVKFRATKSGKLSDMLGMSSRITKAEGYNATNDRLEVALRFNSATGSTIAGVGFELYQNVPNPFVSKTFVGFHLPEAAEATLTVYDETGRTVFTQKGQFGKGYNAIPLDRSALNTTGVLYYKLETATDSATKKMIQTK